jgi:uncharacterized membrane protein HdeD (DUF308 family)
MTTATSPIFLPTRTMLITLGVIGVILGVMVLAWPAATVLVLAWLLGINFILAGIVSTVAGVSEEMSGGQRILTILFGLLSVLAGVVVFARPAHSLAIVAVVVGAFWVVGGIAEFIAGLAGRVESRVLAALSGLVSIVAGIAVIAWPGLTVLVLVWIAGLWMITFGIIRIVMGLRAPRVAAA